MHTYALTFVSKDEPGIVAKVSKVLYDKGFNIADSSSTRLREVFSMILLVKHEKLYSVEEIKQFFFSAHFKPAVHIMEDKDKSSEIETEHYIISVYGADKPGIVHKVTQKLFEHNVNIVDLQTQPAGSVYIMILEVTSTHETSWIDEVKLAAGQIPTDINIRHIETVEL